MFLFCRMSTSLEHLLDNFHVDMTVDMGEVTSGVPNPSSVAVPDPTPNPVDLGLASGDQVPAATSESPLLPSKESAPSLKGLPTGGQKRPAEDQAGASAKRPKKKKSSGVSFEEAPRFAAWADAQDPPRLSNVAILHACMENVMIKEDIESIDREHGDNLAEFACLGGFSVVQSIAVLERRRRDAVDQLKKLQKDSESWLSERQKMEEEAGEATGLIQQLRSSVSAKTREISALEARVRTLSEEVESLQSSSGALTKERDDLKKEEERLRRRLGDSGSFYSQVMTQYRLAIGAKLREQNPGVDLSGVNQLDPASLAKEVKAKLDKQKQDALKKA
ncbi:uncharacterized protein LOC126678787 [Mercurialis annua]|uniref:uncharacterized protein LOC126672926 n=1 Tax=Mercurialis annua TaxID=3986 RepID=UPI00215FF0F1|nr:uncharacterized protein LOC126672926 [Mercurialis annua]XP_050229648.1 uncharacterized protein LOC126678787 [Mercurialis annua]